MLYLYYHCPLPLEKLPILTGRYARVGIGGMKRPICELEDR
jgi:hypothetical protein